MGTTILNGLKAISLGLLLTLGLSTLAHAALIGRLPATLGGTDYQAVYDTDLDITWLADANLIASNSFGLLYDTDLGDYPSSSYIEENNRIYRNGTATWSGASHWIDAMNASNSGAGYLGYGDWRLPDRHDDTIGSELNHLFRTELGGRGQTIETSAINSGDPDLALFNNIKSIYWSGTDSSTDEYKWVFRVYSTQNDTVRTKFSLNVIAVRDGDVAAVPVPAAVWLMGSALAGLIGFRKKKA